MCPPRARPRRTYRERSDFFVGRAVPPCCFVRPIDMVGLPKSARRPSWTNGGLAVTKPTSDVHESLFVRRVLATNTARRNSHASASRDLPSTHVSSVTRAALRAVHEAQDESRVSPTNQACRPPRSAVMPGAAPGRPASTQSCGRHGAPSARRSAGRQRSGSEPARSPHSQQTWRPRRRGSSAPLADAVRRRDDTASSWALRDEAPASRRARGASASACQLASVRRANRGQGPSEGATASTPRQATPHAAQRAIEAAGPRTNHIVKV